MQAVSALNIGTKSDVNAKDPPTDYESAVAFVRPWTMVHDAKLRFAYDAVEVVNRLNIKGDIVEAGVWKGGASMLMAISHLHHSPVHGLERHCWLYDTFEGLPEPDSAKDDSSAKDFYNRLQKGEISKEEARAHKVEEGKWNYGPQQLVQKNMISTGFPENKIHYVRGRVETTLEDPNNVPDKIAILRLDTDWYDSTKAELKHLLPRLQPGGLLIIDDYCYWKGSRTATDEILDKSMFSLATSEPLCAYAWKPRK